MIKGMAKRVMPDAVRHWLWHRHHLWPLPGWVRFGSLRRVTPICRDFGFSRIVLANQLVGWQAIRYVLDELRRDPEFEFWCLVDSLAGAQRLARVAATRPAGRPLRVLLELGFTGGRAVSADLDGALTLVDALDLMGAPVHATVLGTLTGAAVAGLAVADRRAAGAHAVVHLTEPRAPRRGLGRDVETIAAEHARQLRRLQERLAAATGRNADEIAADMRTGRLLSTEEAREYGLIDP